MRWDYTGSTWSHYYVMDGKYMWDLDRLNKVFSKQRVYRGSIKAYVRDDPVLHFYLQSDPMKFLDRATDIVVSKRKEDGAEFDLISWRAPDPYGRGTQVESTLWLDAGRLPRRFTRTSDWRGRLEVQTIEYVKIDLSPKVAADAFAFKPPEGAVEKPIPGWAPDTDGTREALKLLGAVHAAFSGTEAMAYEVEMTQVIDGEKTPGARTFTTLKRSDFIRMESRGETNRHTYIIDGEIMWTVMSQGQNYTKQELMTGGHRMVSGLDPFVQVFFDGEQPLDFLSGGQDIAGTRSTARHATSSNGRDPSPTTR
jgi:outer membrane lipoprotein-sorting protein